MLHIAQYAMAREMVLPDFSCPSDVLGVVLSSRPTVFDWEVGSPETESFPNTTRGFTIFLRIPEATITQTYLPCLRLGAVRYVGRIVGTWVLLEVHGLEVVVMTIIRMVIMTIATRRRYH